MVVHRNQQRKFTTNYNKCLIQLYCNIQYTRDFISTSTLLTSFKQLGIQLGIIKNQQNFFIELSISIVENSAVWVQKDTEPTAQCRQQTMCPVSSHQVVVPLAVSMQKQNNTNFQNQNMHDGWVPTGAIIAQLVRPQYCLNTLGHRFESYRWLISGTHLYRIKNKYIIQ